MPQRRAWVHGTLFRKALDAEEKAEERCHQLEMEVWAHDFACACADYRKKQKVDDLHSQLMRAEEEVDNAAQKVIVCMHASLSHHTHE